MAAMSLSRHAQGECDKKEALWAEKLLAWYSSLFGARGHSRQAKKSNRRRHREVGSLD